VAEIKAKSRVVMARDNFGRFAARCDEAAVATVARTVKEGEEAARALAPVGKASGRKKGDIPLRRSMRSTSEGTRGYWYSISQHALYVELGTSPHIIKGRLHFFWKGGEFVWNNPHFGPVGSGRLYENWDESGAWVFHPGTRAQPFLRPSYDQVARHRMMQIAKEEFPG
jgi:hypothetical protein